MRDERWTGGLSGVARFPVDHVRRFTVRSAPEGEQTHRSAWHVKDVAHDDGPVGPYARAAGLASPLKAHNGRCEVGRAAALAWGNSCSEEGPDSREQGDG